MLLVHLDDAISAYVLHLTKYKNKVKYCSMNLESRKFRLDEGQDIPDPKSDFKVLEPIEGPNVPTDVAEILSLMRRGFAEQVGQMINDGRISDELAKVPIPINEVVKIFNEGTAELRQLANTDALTGLYNKRVLLEAIQTRINSLHNERRETGPKSFAVIMIDIDHFKLFNDTHGHDVGDEVLKIVANTLNSAIRTGANGSDIAARYGGEEFGLIIDGVDTDEKMQTVLDTLHALEFPNDWKDITLSIGGAICTPDTVPNDATAMLLLKQADIHLYRVKKSGRNGYSFPSKIDNAKRIMRNGNDDPRAEDNIKPDEE